MTGPAGRVAWHGADVDCCGAGAAELDCQGEGLVGGGWAGCLVTLSGLDLVVCRRGVEMGEDENGFGKGEVCLPL